MDLTSPKTIKDLLSKYNARPSKGLGQNFLIDRNILEKIKFRYELNTFDDRWFFLDLYNLGVKVYADTSLKCKHLIYNRPYPWKNIKK